MHVIRGNRPMSVIRLEGGHLILSGFAAWYVNEYGVPHLPRKGLRYMTTGERSEIVELINGLGAAAGEYDGRAWRGEMRDRLDAAEFRRRRNGTEVVPAESVTDPRCHTVTRRGPLSVKQAAAEARCSPEYIRRLARDCGIGVKIDGRWLMVSHHVQPKPL